MTREENLMENNPYNVPFETPEFENSKNAWMQGAHWADEHPNGFIVDYHSTKDLTNKEFIELLKQYPEDAYISVECCNPRAMIYDEKNNLIRID